MDDTTTKSNNLDNDSDSYVDITQLVTTAASALTYTDPILCDTSTFDLYDTMAALELRDTKMDSCEIPSSFYTTMRGRTGGENGEEEERHVPPRPAPTKLHRSTRGGDGDCDDFTMLPWEGLTLEDVNIILRETMTRLESYLSGSNLAESVYTFLYAHDVILFEMKIYLCSSSVKAKKSCDNGDLERDAARWALYGVSLLVVKLAQLIRNVVRHADIYEEEDFSLSTYNFTFFSSSSSGGSKKEEESKMDCSDNNEGGKEEDDVDMVDVHKVTGRAIDALKRLKDEPNDSSSSGSIDCREGMERMLTFYLDFYDCCQSLSQLSKQNLSQSVQNIKAKIQKGIKNINTLNQSLQTTTNSNRNSSTILFRAFDPYVNRHLLGNVPMRQVQFNTPLQSLLILQKIFTDMDDCVCNLLLHGTSLSRIQRMLQHISSPLPAQQNLQLEPPQYINIINRSLIISALYFDDLLLGQHVLGIAIAQHMHQCGVPDSVTNTDDGHRLLNRMGKPVYDIFKLNLLNPSRRRAFLDGVMWKDWTTLQKEACLVDSSFREEFELDAKTMPFVTNYVVSWTVELMAQYVSLGIELRLFPGFYDLEMAYWYLDFLWSTQLNQRKTLRDSMMTRREMQAKIEMEEAAAAAAAAVSSATKNGKGGKKKGKKSGKRGSSNKQPPPLKQIEMKLTKEDMEDNCELLAIELKRSVSRSIVRFIAALNQSKVLSTPQYKFTTLCMCFQKRFQSFQSIQQPPPLTYEDFLKGSDFSSVSPLTLLGSTSDSLSLGKSIYDSIVKQNKSIVKPEYYCAMRTEEAMSLRKVCIGNSLFLHRLGQSIENGGDDAPKSFKVSFDFTANKQFCSINIS